MTKVLKILGVIVLMTTLFYGCSLLDSTELAKADISKLGIEYKENDGNYEDDDFSWLTNNNTPQDKKDYTIFVLINGTNLESDSGCATSDISEMLESKFNEENINVILMTGGTEYWQNDAIPDYTAISYVSNDGLIELANLDYASIVDYNVVSSFIDYGMTTFPAEKYGFVFWNHGGGTIGGYGSDDNYDGAGMSVEEIGLAFSDSKASEEQFEFIGFDCCLMATAEVSLFVSPFSKYLIASEELEPGYGWDYNWLRELSNKSTANGDEIGKIITDMFVDSYEDSDWEATLSVIKLDELDDVFYSLNELSKSASDSINSGDFNSISKARRGTKSFAVSEPDEDSYDLIDIKHFAKKLENKFPNESQQLISAVENAVIYYRNSDNVKNAYGISTYFPYLAKESASYGVSVYEELYNDVELQDDYVSLIDNFSNNLNDAKVERRSITRAKPKLSNGNEVSIKLDEETLNDINKITFTIWKQLEEGSDYFIKLGVDSDVDIRDDGTIKTMFDGYWATIGGKAACFYELERGGDTVKYMTPAMLNGKDVKLILMFDDKNPDGKLLGAIPEPPKGTKIAPKNIIPIKKGDKLALKYFAQLFLENEEDIAKYSESEKWIKDSEFTVNDNNLNVKIEPVGDELYMYGFWIEDIQNNNYYTDFIEIKYK